MRPVLQRQSSFSAAIVFRRQNLTATYGSDAERVIILNTHKNTNKGFQHVLWRGGGVECINHSFQIQMFKFKTKSSGFPLSRYCHDCAESDLKQYSLTQ